MAALGRLRTAELEATDAHPPALLRGELLHGKAERGKAEHEERGRSQKHCPLTRASHMSDCLPHRSHLCLEADGTPGFLLVGPLISV